MLALSQHTNTLAVEDAGPGQLPYGWTLATISELIGRDGVFTDGDWIESKDQDPGGDVRLIQLADVGDGVYLDKSSRFLTAEKSHELKCTYLVPRDVLIARMPDPLGRACIYPGNLKTSVTAVDVCIVRTGVNGPDHHWLAWFVNSPEFRANVASLQSGSTRKRISRKNLATITLPVPPLAEQHRIVAEIEKQLTRLDASVAALRRVQANLKRYRASVLKAACEGRLVATEAELARTEGRDYESADYVLERILSERRAQWEAQEKRHGKYKEPPAPDTSDLPELPESWVWASLAVVGEVRLGRQRSPKRAKGPHMRPYLRAANVTWHGLDLSDVKEMDFSPNEYETYRLHRGDILLAEASGSADEVGKPATWDEQIEDCCFQNTLIRVRVFPEVVPYLYYHLLSDARSGALGRAARGVGIHHLGAQRAESWVIALPPLAEQRRIVAEVERRLSVIEQAEATVEASLKRAGRLRQSVLKQAFSGKLVPQDPNDEPAAALLERIRVEREEVKAAAKSNGTPRRRRTPKPPFAAMHP